jgi:PAS domain S-box-containing protein
MKTWPRVVAVSAAAVLVVGGIAWVSYQRHIRELEASTVRNLESIRQLKVSFVRQWRTALHADGDLLSTIPALIQYAAASRPHDRAHLEEVLNWVRPNFAPRGATVMLIAPEDAVPDWDGVPALVAEARLGTGTTLSDFFRNADGMRLAVVSPVLRADQQASGFVTLLIVDPSATLLPALATWPGPSPSGETLLVTRDGTDAIYVSGLRHVAKGPLELRVPLSQTHLPAVRALTRHQPLAWTSAIDYRGVEVMAAAEQVAGSNWAVVAKLDVSEVYAPLAAVQRFTWIALGGAALTGAFVVLWLLARRDASILRESVAARRAEDRLALALRSSGIGLWDWDVESNAVYFSAEYKAQLGYADDELESSWQAWQEHLHPDDHDRAVVTVQRYIADPWPGYAQEFRMRHRDGDYRHIEARGEGQFVDGRMVRMTGCHIDVSAQKRLEAQFRHAQKMEAVGRLAGGVAHDFNNVLTVISGYVEYLLDDPSSPIARELKEIQRAAKSAERLTRQLLVFSRSEKRAEGVTDVNQLLKDWQKLLGRTLGDDIAIQLDLGEGPALVQLDTERIEQAVMNLAVNARDAMRGGGTLTLRTMRRRVERQESCSSGDVKPGDYWVVSVQDTGSGIPSAVAPHIFEPFFTTKSDEKGTGLGLATVHGIATGCGGAVCFTTSPSGTTFSLFLPVAQRAAEVETPAPALRPAGTGRRVLIVDDDEAVRTVLAREVARLGHIAEAGDAAHAVAKVHATRFDVLLTDVVMPHLSGMELAELMRKSQPWLEVIYMTGYAAPDLDKPIPPGAAVLRKPMTTASLAQALKQTVVPAVA